MPALSRQAQVCASCKLRAPAAGCAASWCDRCFHLDPDPAALMRALHDAACQVACTAHAALATVVVDRTAVPAPLAVPQFPPAVAGAQLVGGAGAQSISSSSASAVRARCFGDAYLEGLRGAHPVCPDPGSVSIDGATYVVFSGEEQDKRRLKRHGLPSVVCSLHARPCLVRVHGLGAGKTAPFALACEACNWDHAQALAWVGSDQQVVPAEVRSMCEAAVACGDGPGDGAHAGELCRHKTAVAHWLRHVADGRPLSDAGLQDARIGVSVCGQFWIGACGGHTVVSHAGVQPGLVCIRQWCTRSAAAPARARARELAWGVCTCACCAPRASWHRLLQQQLAALRTSRT